MHLKVLGDKPSVRRSVGRPLNELTLLEGTRGRSTFRDSLSEVSGQKNPPSLKDEQIHLVAPSKVNRLLESLTGLFCRAFFTIRGTGSSVKHLHLTETVSLGEKRFVAIVHAEGQKFLIGGSSSGVSLLTRLDDMAKSIDSLQSLPGDKGVSV
jgi:hypothetical protein